MQKSFLIALIAAAVGALVIFQFLPTFPAYLAFILGAVLAIGIFAITPSGNDAATVETEYTGPTMTLYVGNLPYRVHEGDVKSLFAEYGPVNSVRLVRDRKTGRRKGFGFVEMSESGAQKAMVKLNDYTFQERTLKVREAKNQDNESEKSDD
ncbi:MULTISPECIES: RNA recognition motif domain-containing protein [Shewanella]|uniref:RNA recognition motif domain-containing protein n=1 Tax=Shewanella TaxID=22 RepID=UPI001C661F22|nr:MULTISPECIES: RNA-binding protein [Shewanella]QYJ75606.1 RNA-binding protein [Shewanella sp. FJAT-52076]QYK05467.1 RNA-binding protein [Shewanella zhangzhouensis]